MCLYVGLVEERDCEAREGRHFRALPRDCWYVRPYLHPVGIIADMDILRSSFRRCPYTTCPLARIRACRIQNYAVERHGRGLGDEPHHYPSLLGDRRAGPLAHCPAGVVRAPISVDCKMMTDNIGS